jgi:hypothetical protein
MENLPPHEPSGPICPTLCPYACSNPAVAHVCTSIVYRNPFHTMGIVQKLSFAAIKAMTFQCGLDEFFTSAIVTLKIQQSLK